jgi:tRNA(Ile)-lysidine synthase
MTPKLNPAALERLQAGKNLLAFSAGVDSTALFFLLCKTDIPFDLVMVDYGVRAQSREEVAYARELVKQYGKRLYLKEAGTDQNNFEANARKIRYDFFSDICKAHGYTVLITAHQLNDRTEWFLMQFTKGAGSVELLGMDYISEEEDYTLVRPMLDIDRETIETYLQTHRIRHYEDESNRNTDYTRNAFRHTLSNPLVKQYAKGIQKSFALLRRDTETLMPAVPFDKVDDLTLIKRSGILADVRQIDRHLKRMGYLLSAAQREEIIRQEESVVGGKIAVSLGEEIICIAPYMNSVMPKETKERFRIAGVPPKIRPYLFAKGISDAVFSERKKAILN